MQKLRNALLEVMDWWNYYVAFEVKFFIGSILVLIVVIFSVSLIEKVHCNNLSNLYGETYRVEYAGVPTGCMVQLPSGVWVDVDNAGYLELGH